MYYKHKTSQLSEMPKSQNRCISCLTHQQRINILDSLEKESGESGAESVVIQFPFGEIDKISVRYQKLRRAPRAETFSDCAVGRGARDVSVLRCGEYPWLAAVWILQSRITGRYTRTARTHIHFSIRGRPWRARYIKILSTWPSDRLRFGWLLQLRS